MNNSGVRMIPISMILASMLFFSGPVAAQNPTVVYPKNAPKIISDIGSMIGANQKRRDSRHQGIDLAGPNGQPIIAAADGKVVDVEVDKCWGPTVAIDHGKGSDGKRLIALYGHLADFLVKEGQNVTRGQLIARLGNNYNNFKCIFNVRHLHFQLGRVRRTGNKGTYWGFLDVLSGIANITERGSDEVDHGDEGSGISVSTGPCPCGLKEAIESFQAGIRVC